MQLFYETYATKWISILLYYLLALFSCATHTHINFISFYISREWTPITQERQHLQFCGICNINILKQSYARFQTNLYVYHIYQQNPQKPPTKKKKNKMNLKVELKNVLNEKPIKKSIKAFQINNWWV